MTHRERKSHKKALKAKAVAASTPGFPSDTEERKAGLQHSVTTSQLAEPQVWGELCATFSTGVLNPPVPPQLFYTAATGLQKPAL